MSIHLYTTFEICDEAKVRDWSEELDGGAFHFCHGRSWLDAVTTPYFRLPILRTTLTEPSPVPNAFEQLRISFTVYLRTT